MRKSGKRLRITAQLIDVESGYHLWSETYDRELTDVFTVQDDITAHIMSALKVHLEAGETAQVTTTTNPDAYDAYRKRVRIENTGRVYVERWNGTVWAEE